jgi:hypothetical protein
MAPQQISKLELRVLRALCSCPDAYEARAQALRLADYSWQEPEHRIVYDALRRLHATAKKRLSEKLPEEATRMGFPDVDWQSYIGAKPTRREDLEEWVAALKKTPTTPARKS